jgi:hypothetical protein
LVTNCSKYSVADVEEGGGEVSGSELGVGGWRTDGEGRYDGRKVYDSGWGCWTEKFGVAGRGVGGYLRRSEPGIGKSWPYLTHGLL